MPAGCKEIVMSLPEGRRKGCCKSNSLLLYELLHRSDILNALVPVTGQPQVNIGE